MIIWLGERAEHGRKRGVFVKILEFKILKLFSSRYYWKTNSKMWKIPFLQGFFCDKMFLIMITWA